MHNAKSRKQAQGSAHLEDEVFKQVGVCPDAVVEMAMVHHVDSLALVKLTFHVEKMLIHCSPFTELVDQPQILLVFHRVLHHAN